MFIPNWKLPTGVGAAITTVTSPGNLAVHVGDDPAQVIRRRRLLQRDCSLPVAPRWLKQVHSAVVVDYPEAKPAATADAIYSDQLNSVCAVLTADCLPILLCTKDGREIAAVHAGWRGLAAGVVGNAVARFDAAPQAIMAYIGPAISMAAFEVGEEVMAAFAPFGIVDKQTFSPNLNNKWQANLPLLAKRMLQQLGCRDIQLSGLCTFNDARWYSYRRDPSCGRFATIIWKK